jgi:hypothetical protein
MDKSTTSFIFKMLLNSSIRCIKGSCHSFMNAVSKSGRALPGNILLLYGDEKVEEGYS